MVDAHRLAEERSLSLHRLIAERLRDDPSILEHARETVQRWRADGRAPFYAEAWEGVLASPLDHICEVLVCDSEESRALRQATPFAGAIGARERWRIWAEVREGHGTR